MNKDIHLEVSYAMNQKRIPSPTFFSTVIICVMVLLLINLNTIHAGNPWKFQKYSNPTPTSFQSHAYTILDDLAWEVDGIEQETGFSYADVQVARTSPYLSTYYHFFLHDGEGEPITHDGEYQVRFITEDSLVRNLSSTCYGPSSIALWEEDAKVLRDDLLSHDTLYFLIKKGNEEITFSISNENYARSVAQILLREDSVPFNTWIKDGWGYDEFFIRSEENPDIFIKLTPFIYKESSYVINVSFYKHFGDGYYGDLEGEVRLFHFSSLDRTLFGIPKWSDMNFFAFYDSDVNDIRQILSTDTPAQLVFSLENGDKLTFNFTGSEEFKRIDRELSSKMHPQSDSST